MKNQISQLIQDVVDGYESAAKTYIFLKELLELCENGLDEIKDIVLEEAKMFDKGQLYYGGTWQIRYTPTYLHYDQDKIYSELYKKLSSRKKELNQAWKAKHEGKGFFDCDTSEIIPILPVKTPGKEIVIFKKSE